MKKRGPIFLFSRYLNLIQRFIKNASFGRNVSLLAGSTAAGQTIMVLATPVLTRLYTPENFGVLALFTAILGMLSCVASLRYELAIPLPENEVDAASVVFLSLLITIALSLVVSLLIWLFGDQALRGIHFDKLLPYIWLLPIGMFLAGIYQVFNYWAVRQRAYVAISKTRLTQATGNVFIQILGGVLGIGPIGLIVGHMTGRAVGTVTLASGFRKFVKKIDKSNIFEMAKRYIKFPKYSCLAATINSASAQIPILLFIAYYGAELAGWFLLSQRIMGAPMSLIGQSTGQVFIGEATTLSRSKENTTFYKLFIRTTKHLFVIGCPVLLIFGFLAPLAFSKLLGSDWEMSGRIALVLTPMYIAQFVVSPVSQTLTILERQNIQLYSDVVRFVVGSGGICITGGILELPVLVVIGIYGLSMMGAYLLLGLISIALLKQKIKLDADNICRLI